MIVYQVTITLQAHREAEWLDWMRRVHVPDVLRTGCFSRCVLAKAIDSAAEEVTYVLRYDCPSSEIYDQYRTTFAPNLQREHTAKFAGCFRGARLLLNEVGTITIE